MRKVASLAAGAAVVCLPLAVHAQDAPPYTPPDGSRILSDPNYLPYAGEFYGHTDYTHTWTSGDTFDSTGAKASSFHVNTDTIGQFLSYGITDDLEVNAAIRYAPDTSRKIDFANGTTTTLDSSGFSDPSLGVVWRAIDQGPSPFLVDFFGNYTLDAIDSKAASPTQDGTIARGGQSGTVGAALGYESPQFGLRGVFDANFYGNSTTLDLGSGDLLRTQGYNDYVLGLESQWRFSPVLSVNAGIDHTFAANQNTTNEVSGVNHVLNPGDVTALHAAVNYHLVPNKVVLSAMYTHDFYGNSSTAFLNPASDTTVHNKSGDTVGVQLYYTLP